MKRTKEIKRELEEMDNLEMHYSEIDMDRAYDKGWIDAIAEIERSKTDKTLGI